MTNKKDETTSISLRPEIYTMIEELRTQFADMTNNPDLTDEDVVAVLINGFIESVEQAHDHEGEGHGCGAGCSCHSEEDE